MLGPASSQSILQVHGPRLRLSPAHPCYRESDLNKFGWDPLVSPLCADTPHAERGGGASKCLSSSAMSNYDSRVRQGFFRCLLLLGPLGDEGQKGLRNLDQGVGCLSPIALVVGPALVEMWHVENVPTSFHVIGVLCGSMFPKSVDKLLKLEIEAACLAAKKPRHLTKQELRRTMDGTRNNVL